LLLSLIKCRPVRGVHHDPFRQHDHSISDEIRPLAIRD
jgi:hypothetical protein